MLTLKVLEKDVFSLDRHYMHPLPRRFTLSFRGIVYTASGPKTDDIFRIQLTFFSLFLDALTFPEHLSQ